MRVVLTGISGLEKEEVLGNTCAFCNSKDFKNSGADNIDRSFDLEHGMCRVEEFRTPNYLDIAEKDLLNAKNKTLNRIIRESEGKKNVILAMHAVYYRRSSLFSVLDWTKLMEFEPGVFITLVDDVHSIKHRIRMNPKAGPVRYISLKDIL